VVFGHAKKRGLQPEGQAERRDSREWEVGQERPDHGGLPARPGPEHTPGQDLCGCSAMDRSGITLTFDWRAEPPADIRISFDRPGSGHQLSPVSEMRNCIIRVCGQQGAVHPRSSGV
jgi:hypothetical protein